VQKDGRQSFITAEEIDRYVAAMAVNDKLMPQPPKLRAAFDPRVAQQRAKARPLGTTNKRKSGSKRQRQAAAP
jgi:hypothetical protein